MIKGNKDYCLILDDDIRRTPKLIESYTHQKAYLEHDWHMVKSHYEFVKHIYENGVPKIVSFDHDLSDNHYDHQHVDIPYDEYEEKTGFHSAKWLILYCIDNDLEVPETIYIHTMNTVGGANIKSLFTTYFKLYDIKHSHINDVTIINDFYYYNYDEGFNYHYNGDDIQPEY